MYNIDVSREQQNHWKAPIGNYYGRPTLKRADDKWFLYIENYGGDECSEEVSEAFAKAWIAEFPQD